MVIEKYIRNYLYKIRDKVDITDITTNIDNDSIDDILNRIAIIYKQDKNDYLIKLLLKNKVIYNSLYSHLKGTN